MTLKGRVTGRAAGRWVRCGPGETAKWRPPRPGPRVWFHDTDCADFFGTVGLVRLRFWRERALEQGDLKADPPRVPSPAVVSQRRECWEEEGELVSRILHPKLTVYLSALDLSG